MQLKIKKIIYADDLGHTGTEKERVISILTSKGDFTFSESTELTTWNIRKIDSSHPLFDNSLNDSNTFMSSIFSKLCSI